jgi:hypothetical protein
MQVATIGLDLAKHVFQIHGIDAAGRVARSISIADDPNRAIASPKSRSATSP